MAYICMLAQNAALGAHGEQPACGPWTLKRVRPPPSVRISRARGLPGDDFRETEHLVLCHVLAADRYVEASPSRGGGGSCLRLPAAEEGGVPLVPERRGHVHFLRPGGDPCFLEHDGNAPLPG